MPPEVGRHGREVIEMRHDDSLATILLTSRLHAKGLQPFKASEYWGLLNHLGARSSPSMEGAGSSLNPEHDPGPDARQRQPARLTVQAGWQNDLGSSGRPCVLLGRSKRELMSGYGLSEDLAIRVTELTNRATALAFELERLEQSGIKTLTIFDEFYPQLWIERLGTKAPPLLHAAGSLNLLDCPGLGVVGNRNVPKAGGEIASEVAQIATKRGLPLVSGGARGVDQIAMNASFQAGGTVVGVLAQSLSRKLKSPDVRRAIYDDSVVMCTPYGPNAPFNVGNAMGRNKLIYAHSTLTVVIASGTRGGTWSGATESLKHGYGPVAVWRGEGEGPGNELLHQHGAINVSSLAEIESLLDSDSLDSVPPETPTEKAAIPGQQSLFTTIH